MSLLEVKDLSFSYGDKQIFSGVSFSVEQGQVFCLVGPNGCGKTTLEHCILTHLKPEQGQIRIRGKRIESYSSRTLAAEIAYVPQNHTRSFPYKTADVVAMGQTRRSSLLHGAPPDLHKVMHCMEQLGIAHLASAEYTTLSGGELQMVLLARALVQESSILVLDEPAAHLDVKRTQDILQTLCRLVEEQNKTILISTHDFNHPLLFQDEGVDVKMALMEHGRLSEPGVPDQLLASGCLKEIYGISSQVLTISADKPRRYLATWSEGGKA